MNEELINRIVDSLTRFVEHMGEECSYDHHGYCQAHALEGKGHCMVENAVSLIKELKQWS